MVITLENQVVYKMRIKLFETCQDMNLRSGSWRESPKDKVAGVVSGYRIFPKAMWLSFECWLNIL